MKATIAFFLTCFLCSSSSPLFSQSGVSYGFGYTYELSSGWDFYGKNYFGGSTSGMGYTGVSSVENGVSGLLLNPASLNADKKLEFNFQFTYKKGITFPSNIFEEPDTKYSLKLPSCYIAAGFKVNKYFQLGFLYANTASFKNYWDNNNVLEPIPFTRTNSVNTIGLPMKLTINKVSLGLMVHYTHYETNIVDIPNTSQPNQYAKADDVNFSFGFIYNPSKYFSIGATTTPATTLDVKSDLQTIGQEVPPKPILPWEFAGGINVKLSKIPLGLAFDMHYKLSNHQMNPYSEIFNYNFGVDYTVSKKLKLRTGFFTMYTNKYASEGQFFLTAGAGYSFGNFDIDMSILDSHVSSFYIKNTLIQSSITYKL